MVFIDNVYYGPVDEETVISSLVYDENWVIVFGEVWPLGLTWSSDVNSDVVVQVVCPD